MKAAEYARYSTDRQTENSIAYQFGEIRRYCRDHDIEIVASYQDEACSGTNADRDGFQRMLRDAQRGSFDAVVIYDVSRGSRDVGDWFTFRKRMMALGITVISATGQRLGDLTNGQDFLLELLTVGMGQAEVLGTRQKSLAGVATKAKQGIFLGGFAPLGYDIVDGQYVINPSEAAVVRKIFDLYAAGQSITKMVDAMQGTLGKRGRPFGKNSFLEILKNERYIGVYTWNKKQYHILRKWAGGVANPNVIRLEGVIPPIIDMTTWERVQKRMNDNKRGQYKARRRYLLTGLIECASCGAAYVGHTSKNAKGHETSYYCCGNRYRTKTCDSKNINAQELESFVVQHLKAFLLEADFTETARVIADRVNGVSPDLTAEKKELDSINAKIRNGVNAILAGMDVPELQDEIDRLRVRKDELEDIIQRRSSERPHVSAAAVEAMLRESVDQWDAEHLQQICKQYVTKIYANADGSVSVNIGVHLTGCGGTHTVLCTTWCHKAA